jgi:hypothetical protein
MKGDSRTHVGREDDLISKLPYISLGLSRWLDAEAGNACFPAALSQLIDAVKAAIHRVPCGSLEFISSADTNVSDVTFRIAETFSTHLSRSFATSSNPSSSR